MDTENPEAQDNATIEAIKSIEGFDGFPKDTKYELTNPTDSIQEHWPEDITGNPELSKNLVSFFIDLTSHKPYFNEEKDGFKKRRLEINRNTGEPETHANHFLYVSEVSSQLHQNLCNWPHENQIIEAIDKIDLSDTDIQTLIILASFCHDWIEDRLKKGIQEGLTYEDVTNQLDEILEKYGFGRFRKYLKPLVRILTHDDCLNSEEYIDKIDKPADEYFVSNELPDADKKGLKAMAKLIKTSDIIHNHLSPQTANALFKDDVYWPAVYNWFPHLKERLPDRFWETALQRNIHAKLWWEYLANGGNPKETSTYNLIYEYAKGIKESGKSLSEEDRKVIRLFLSLDVEYIKGRIKIAVNNPKISRAGIEKILSVSIKEGSTAIFDDKKKRDTLKNKSIDEIVTEVQKRILALNEFQWIIKLRQTA